MGLLNLDSYFICIAKFESLIRVWCASYTTCYCLHDLYDRSGSLVNVVPPQENIFNKKKMVNVASSLKSLVLGYLSNGRTHLFIWVVLAWGLLIQNIHQCSCVLMMFQFILVSLLFGLCIWLFFKFISLIMASLTFIWHNSGPLVDKWQ